MRRLFTLSALTLLLASLLAACGSNAASPTTGSESNPNPTAAGGDAASGAAGQGGDLASLSGEIKLDGSSTVFPIAEAVAEEFGAAAPQARVTVGVSGTGGGFKRFCAGETAISNASRPIKESEIEACKAAGIEFVELPVAYDGLSVVVNPQNDWVSCIKEEELATMWAPEAQGQVTTWQQVNQAWPADELVLYGPGTDSGTFDYFTEHINGESGASRGDYTASEDDNVLVQGIQGDTNAVGYFGYAYYIENQDKLKALEVDGGNGCVGPTAATINDGSYPLARPIFIYVNKAELARPEVQAFVTFFLEQAPALVAEVGYVALPDQAYDLGLERVAQGTAGSTFSGQKGSVIDLLN